ncbi:MAG: hypothetical protein RBS39_05695 [Phycisphaerales bacterium]|jgi:hypothetical protein|nr:hypothetical protein [Phycisphaerales bacterium]
MIHPAPVSTIDPALARGTLREVIPASVTRPAYAVVTFANTDYQLHLVPEGEVRARPGTRTVGVISARAKRIDVCGTGGRYVEPVIGTPRRVQGSIIRVDAASNEIVVHAGVPVHVTPTDPRQKAGDFEVGQFVTFGVENGASYREQA